MMMEHDPKLEITLTLKCGACGSELRAEPEWPESTTLIVEPCQECTVACEGCGERLHASWGHDQLDVQPCDKCLEEAREEGREEEREATP